MAAACLLGVVACGLHVVGTASSATEPSGDASIDDALSQDVAPTTDDAGSDAPIVKATVDAAGVARPIYVAADDAIWRLTPPDDTFVRIGTLDDTCNSPNIEELAIDAAGQLYGTSSDSLNLYKITLGSTVTCTVILNALTPFSLAFAPANGLRAESLVAFGAGGDYFRIDRLTGVRSVISATGMQPYAPGGDVVSAGGTLGYVAAANHASIVTTPPQAICAHCIVEVDLGDGHFVRRLGDIGNASIYGTAFSAGKIYGFANDNGLTYVITPSPFSVTTLPAPEADLHWHGATSSPVP